MQLLSERLEVELVVRLERAVGGQQAHNAVHLHHPHQSLLHLCLQTRLVPIVYPPRRINELGDELEVPPVQFATADLLEGSVPAEFAGEGHGAEGRLEA